MNVQKHTFFPPWCYTLKYTFEPTDVTDLLSSIAGTGADGAHIFFLPLVPNLEHFPIIVTG